MIRALQAEWTKLRTMPATGWALLSVVVLTVGLSVLVTASTSPSSGCGDVAGCPHDLTLLSLSGVTVGQLGAVLLGVLVVSAEYESMMIRSTFAAEPRRVLVFAAKAVVVTGLVLIAGLVGVLGSLFAGGALLAGNGFPAGQVSLADEATSRAALGTVLYFGLVGLLSLGVAAALRQAATAVSAVMALLYLPVVLAMVVPMSAQVRDRVTKYSPMSAGLNVRATIETIPIGPWAGLGVLAAYTCGGILLGYALLATRDA